MLPYQNVQEDTLYLVERQGPALAPFKGLVVLPALDPCNTAHACVRGKQHCNHTTMYAVHEVSWAFRACHMPQRWSMHTECSQKYNRRSHMQSLCVTSTSRHVTQHTADQVDAPAISDLRSLMFESNNQHTRDSAVYPTLASRSSLASRYAAGEHITLLN
jgi:hypothetical protein